jgi:flagellar hook-associated protein 1 FlgK
VSATFASFNSALSALRYHQVVMDTASGNIANVSTEGYARRRVVGEAVGAPAVPAMWSRYEGSGDGVRAKGIERMVDPFLDIRARREHGNQAYLDTQQTTLERLEAGIGEPGDNGVSAALADFRKAWHDLANNPGTDAARSQVLAAGRTLASAINIQSRNVSTEEADQRIRLLNAVDDVNTLAADLAATNRSIDVARNSGADAGTLLDQRDQLAMRLAELTGGTAQTNANGGLDFSVGGQPLVQGLRAGSVAVATGVAPDGSADGNPVTFTVARPDGSSAAPTEAFGGVVGATTLLLNTTLPAYKAGLDAVASSLADSVNTQHAAGYDRNGVAGGAFFTYDPADPAASLAVANLQLDEIAASSIPGGGLDGGNATAVGGELAGAEGDYQRLVNVFGSEVSSVRRLAANQQVLTGQVDGAREQLSGINLDEEMVNMLQAQRAYEAAARVMSTLDSVLDTLINRTGLVR